MHLKIFPPSLYDYSILNYSEYASRVTYKYFSTAFRAELVVWSYRVAILTLFVCSYSGLPIFARQRAAVNGSYAVNIRRCQTTPFWFLTAAATCFRAKKSVSKLIRPEAAELSAVSVSWKLWRYLSVALHASLLYAISIHVWRHPPADIARDTALPVFGRICLLLSARWLQIQYGDIA